MAQIHGGATEKREKKKKMKRSFAIKVLLFLFLFLLLFNRKNEQQVEGFHQGSSQLQGNFVVIPTYIESISSSAFY